MIARHVCKACNGSGKIFDGDDEGCYCEVMPVYTEIFSDREWNTYSFTEIKQCYYAQAKDTLVVLQSDSTVHITRLGTLPWDVTPRSVEALNKLCEALGAKIL
jgi:hypothetical protein